MIEADRWTRNWIKKYASLYEFILQTEMHKFVINDVLLTKAFNNFRIQIRFKILYRK